MTSAEPPSERQPRRWLIVHGTHAGVVGEEVGRSRNREGEFVLLRLPDAHWPQRQVAKRLDALQVSA